MRDGVQRIAIIQGHPDPGGNHFGHALADAYRQGALEAGHEVTVIDVARLDFPVLRRQKDWESDASSDAIKDAQHKIGASDHLVFFYPLWLGAMPALLKAFLEQTLRPGFAITAVEGGVRWEKLLVGKSARIVVTMGMPALIYRWYFRAHSLKSFERNILGFCGIGPVKESLIGMVASESPTKHSKWLARMRKLGGGAR